jgi:integral membrane protein (TIGR00529 family)
LGLVDPAIAIIASLAFLIALLYKRVNLGITLNVTAQLLALLALDWATIPPIIWQTTTDPLAISVVLATFGIMLLSQLYKETGIINKLSESVGNLIKNPKIVLSVLPAIIGLLPVAGGALMSAPLVDTEAEKLKLKPDRKAYVNIWFRHTVFPVYPLSPPIITTAALTGVAIPLIIMRQIPVVLVMIIIGFIIGFWKVPKYKNEETNGDKQTANSNLKTFLVTFSPILATIIVAISMDSVGLSLEGFHTVIAILVGLLILIVISKLNFAVFKKPFKGWGIYGITAAAYGAFLLRKIMITPEISNVFLTFVTNGGGTTSILLLITIPAILGVLTGSPVSGVAVSIPILCGTSLATPSVAALIYISAYLGYTIAPTHLCFTFTADYFKCTLGKVYKYVIPSFLVTFPMALFVYFLL